MVMGVEAEDTAVMDSSTASPGEKLGGSMASVMEIEGGAGVVMLMFSLRKRNALSPPPGIEDTTTAALAGTFGTWQGLYPWISLVVALFHALSA
jgi:hypothetical protein